MFDSSTGFPSKIVVKYLVFGSLWIIFSDQAIEYSAIFGVSPNYLQTYKGLGFIIVTAGLLFMLLRHDFRKIQIAVKRKEQSELRYRTAFRDSPNPLWEEDLSEVRKFLLEKKLPAAISIESQLEMHPQWIEECISRVRVLDINNAALRAMGLSSGESIRGSLSHRFVSDPSAFLKREMIAIAKGETRFELQLEVEGAGQEQKTLLIRWSALAGHELTYDRAMVSAFDITELERIKNRLQQSESRYRSLLESVGEGVVVIQDGRIVFVNPQMSEVSGKSEEQLLGAVYDTCLIQEDKNELRLSLEALYVGTPFPENKRVRICDPNGEIRCLQVNAVMLDWNGHPAVMAMLADISEQNKLEQINKEMQSRVSQAQRMEAIGTLAGGIAHDFNNLLSAILGYSRLTLEELPPGSQAYEHLGVVISAGERAGDLVSQILTFSRKTEEEKQPIQVGLVIREAVKMLRSSIPSHIEIEQDIRTAKYIEIDPSQMHRVVMNLCTNSYQAMIECGGRIHVSLTEYLVEDNEPSAIALPPGSYLRLTIADTGCGIAPESIGNIFDPYFTTKEGDRGTGLGLSVVYGIVEGAGGKIAVKSGISEGSCFDLYFPEYLEEVRETAVVEEGFPLQGQEKILLVDDETSVLRLMQRYLELHGYRVSAYSRAKDALAELQRSPLEFDAVVTDLAMPGMTGRQFAKEIARLRPFLPVILCSGLIEDVRPIDSQSNIVSVLQKPFDKTTFVKAVQAVLEKGE